MAQAIRKCGMIALALLARLLPPNRKAGWVKSNRTIDLRGK